MLDAMLVRPEPVSVATLGRAVGLTTAAAQAAVERLAALGCELDAHPQRGVRLARVSLNCWADYIEPRHAGRLGRRLIVYERTASTQDIARTLIGADVATAHGAVVAADHQTAGRGRLGRRWMSRPGAQLLLTVIVGPPVAPVDRVMLATGLAVARCCESLSGCAMALHWPNDVYADGRKLAGILVERAGPATLIGIGLNCDFAGAAPDVAGTVQPIDLATLGARIDRLAALDRLLDDLHATLMHATDADLADAWRRRAGLLQHRVTVRSDGRELTGRVIDIDPARGLVLELQRGPTVVLPAATTSILDAAAPGPIM